MPAASSQQPFPRLNTPLVNSDLTINLAWQQLLISFWVKLGRQGSITPNQVYIQRNSQTLAVEVYLSATGEFLGNLILGDEPGGPVQPLVPGTSPFNFTAGSSGWLLVFGAKVEVSRDHGVNYYPVTLNGGQIILKREDSARISWFSATPPAVAFFPDQ
jgi:hypothetical protein